jgi:DNA helicase-2/ATP-dependent DNA helicase PcrA
MLAGGWGNICVVGDDDQSIYKFRGATIENILSFEKQYKGCRTIRLEQNYRSTGHILDAANAVISNNTERKGKTLWTDAGAGDKILLYASQNEDDEAQFVAAKIMEDFGRGGSFRDNAVLYRMNAQSNRLEFAFKRNAVPYRIVGGMRFFDRAEIKDMLAYLWVLQSPKDDLRLMRIINSPQRGIGDRTVEIAQEIAARTDRSLYEIISRADEHPELSRAAAKLIQFTTMMDGLRGLAQTAPLDELYDELLERTGYIRALQTKNTDENLARIENVNELKTNILGYIKETGDATLSGFLDEVALYTDLDGLDADADCAVMMTMHSAKGLEFPNVFIVGAEEGIFPGLRSIGSPEDMEEERRLCYVALTRAKRRLYITCARQRMLFGRTTENRPSRFVNEIPQEHLDRAGYLPPRRQQSVDFAEPAKKAYVKPAVPPAQAAAPAFVLGDRIVHTAFGGGEITKVTPMGGDALIEITFDGAGVKRLMLRAAGQHMRKE